MAYVVRYQKLLYFQLTIAQSWKKIGLKKSKEFFNSITFDTYHWKRCRTRKLQNLEKFQKTGIEGHKYYTNYKDFSDR